MRRWSLRAKSPWYDDGMGTSWGVGKTDLGGGFVDVLGWVCCWMCGYGQVFTFVVALVLHSGSLLVCFWLCL